MKSKPSIETLQARADKALRDLEDAYAAAAVALRQLQRAREEGEAAALTDVIARIAEMKTINRSG